MGLRTLTLFYLFFFTYGILFPAAAPAPENTGCRFLRNYNRENYGFADQNWSLLQDRRGIIYAANSGGLLDYDGIYWGGTILPNKKGARSLTTAKNSGVIYVGGYNEIGFIAPVANRSPSYMSLLRHIDEKEQDFGRVWKTHATKEGIYFRTSQFIFRWQPEQQKMKTWRPLVRDSGFAGSFVCRGKLFIRHKQIGLMRMKDDELKLVPGGDLFAKKGIYAMFPYNERELVIGTRDGLYLFNGSRMLLFPTDVDDYIKENILSYGIKLESSPGRFALSTLRGGLVIIDSRGRVKEIFSKASGLQSDNVKYVFEDARGNLWLALENGISKIEYSSPFSFYNAEMSALQGFVLSVTRHGPRQDLYAGTTWGLFLLERDGKFRKLPGIKSECFALLSTGGSLFAATNNGLLHIDTIPAAPAISRIIAAPVYFLLPSRRMPGHIWARTGSGLILLTGQKARWQIKHRFEDIGGEIAHMVEDKEGDLWLGSSGGVIKIDFPALKKSAEPSSAGVIYYSAGHGLPDNSIDPFESAGHTVFATEKGIYRFDEKKEHFSPDYTFGEEFANGSRNVSYLAEDRRGNVWFYSQFENFRAIRQPGGAYRIDPKPFRRLPRSRVNAIYPDPIGNKTWFAGNQGLIGFDNKVKKDYDSPFPAFIRRVKLADDTLPTSRIEYKDRNIRFMYAAPFFEDEAATRFQVFLEGNGTGWSGWTSESIKEYSNLDAGPYTFRVRARNVYGTISREETFRFRVLPPYYRTWWAYFVYTVLFFLGLYFIIRWQSGKLLREKQRLEKIVKERTKEVYEKNLLLEEQSGKLQEMDRMKSRFFANISHEFRTPLTLIMGPLEQVLSGCRDDKQAESIDMALRNSRRLLALINQLLDLSKLESGGMKLQTNEQDIIPLLKGIVGSFESLIVQKKLSLTFHTQEEQVFLYFDSEKLEKITVNLLANAVKFTPSGGSIKVTATIHPVKEENYPGGYFEIKVADTGVGIPKKQLPYIFDRFYQAGSASSHRQHKGSGIGLALVQELIQLHHGKIEVQSKEGKGTEFTLRLPLGKTHLKPGEIILDKKSASPAPEQRTHDEPVAYSGKDIHRPGEPEEYEADTDNEDDELEPEIKEKEVILVVEDNPDVRKYIRAPLQKDYTVLEAIDGKKGVEKARKTIPDLIISDIMMPETDGYELCRILKKDVKTSHIPIVLLTAKASEESIIAGLETGADDYITKPFNIDILLIRIKNLIDLRRGLQEKFQREMALQPTEIAVSSVDRQFMKELKQAIEKNLSEPEFGVDELAQNLYMGRATLNRKIRALTGESTRQFIQSYRLKRAAQLLKANFGNITEVSFEVGFSSSGYFSKCFKKKFQQLPHAFQESEI
jgi:signal transduction histidine kinase/DNA-binding response OmpR family regulator/ligand-binding sensor domain-containing protein